MNTVIWKFRIPYHHTRVAMPTEAKILSVAFQGRDLMLWAACNPDFDLEERPIEVYCTGERQGRPIQGTFIGTAFHPAGLVLHVFDGKA